MRGLVAVCWLWSGTAVAKTTGRCVVEGKKFDPILVDVAPKEAAPFKLHVAGVPAAAMPEPAGQPAHVEVRGPVAFEGTAPAEKIPWKTAREVQGMSGMLRLPRATELKLYATAFARVVDAEVKIGSIHIRGFTLPCKNLTLDPVEQPEAAGDSNEGGTGWVAGVKLLHFHHAAGSGPQIEVVVGDDLTALEMHQLESSGAWVRVSCHWADGTTLVGWVKRDELKPAPPRHEQLGEPFVTPTSCSRDLPNARSGERTANARVTAGTQVYAARYVGPWGVIKTADPLTVRFRDRDDWVSIVSVPGIASPGECPEHSAVLDEAWVPRQSVQLPSPSPAP